MPDPTFKIDGATVLSKSGTTVSVDSGVTVPASIGASLVFISSTSSTSNASELKFENTFNDTSYYKYVVEAFLYPETNDRHIRMQLGYGGSSTTWITGSYRTIVVETNFNGSADATPFDRSSTDAGMELQGTGGSSTDAGAYVTMNIPRPYESSRYKMWEFKASKQEQNDYFIHQSGISSWVGGTNAFTAIKFYAHDYSGGGSHGGINGEVKLYGLKGS